MLLLFLYFTALSSRFKSASDVYLLSWEAVKYFFNIFIHLPIYNVPIDVDMNFDPNPILWTLENTLIPIRGHQTVPLL